MNQECSDAYDLGDLECAQDCVAQQRFAEPLVLEPLINGEAAQNHQWYWVRHIAPDPAGSTLTGYGARG